MRDIVNYEVFIRRMDIFRRKRGMTKKELSHAIGKGDSYISIISKNYHNPSLECVLKICEVLDMPKPKINI